MLNTNAAKVWEKAKKHYKKFNRLAGAVPVATAWLIWIPTPAA
jgi:hypothetical protein